VRVINSGRYRSRGFTAQQQTLKMNQEIKIYNAYAPLRMKMYVTDPNNQKIFLNVLASSREELARALGSRRFNLMGRLYTVSQVYAETSDDNTSTGLVVGGVIGFLGGPGNCNVLP
jgi:hypothetical protein